MHADFFGLQFFFDTDFKIWGKLQNMPASKKTKIGSRPRFFTGRRFIILKINCCQPFVQFSFFQIPKEVCLDVNCLNFFIILKKTL